jgi:hypothetical protein
MGRPRTLKAGNIRHVERGTWNRAGSTSQLKHLRERKGTFVVEESWISHGS